MCEYEVHLGLFTVPIHLDINFDTNIDINLLDTTVIPSSVQQSVAFHRREVTRRCSRRTGAFRGFLLLLSDPLPRVIQYRSYIDCSHSLSRHDSMTKRHIQCRRERSQFSRWSLIFSFFSGSFLKIKRGGPDAEYLLNILYLSPTHPSRSPCSNTGIP